MKQIKLKYGASIQIRYEDLPNAYLWEINKDKIEFFTTGKIAPLKEIAIAEIFVPRGGRNLYGLLGVSYKAHSNSRAIISIPQTNPNIYRSYKDSTLTSHENLYVGILDEYKESILSCAKDYLLNNECFLQGELIFNYAAFSNESTSLWILNKLTNIVLFALYNSENHITQSVVEELLAVK